MSTHHEANSTSSVGRFFSNHSTTIKMFLVGALTLLLMVPLGMVRGLLWERMSMKQSAEYSVAEGWGGAQVISPPFLSASATTQVTEEVEGKQIVRRYVNLHSLLPDQVTAAADIKVELRTVGGTYKMPVFLADIAISGSFAPEDLALFSEVTGLDLNSTQFEFLVSDVRGLSTVQNFSLDGISLAASSLGSAFQRSSSLGSAISAPSFKQRAESLIRGAIEQRRPLPFELRFQLRGVQALQMLPLARLLKLDMSSQWPDPSFLGGILPERSSVSKEGFKAHFSVSEFNRDFPALAMRTQDSSGLHRSMVGVSLLEANDVYQRNDRAGKYGFLFLALSIAGFFLIEILLKVRLHPMHYLQIGLALGLFYLLLLALSERTGFDLAFALAAAAVTILIAGYTASVLKGFARGALAAVVIAATYAFLYVLIAREQFALLLGSVGLFAVLALIMFLTRKIDWYGNKDSAAQ
jgi:inner membrane protein